MKQNIFEKEFLHFFSGLDSASPHIILKEIHNFVSKYFSIFLSGIYLCKGQASKIIRYPELKDIEKENLYLKQKTLNLLEKENKAVVKNSGDIFNSFPVSGTLKQSDNVLLLPLQENNDFLGVLFFCFHGTLNPNEDFENVYTFIAKYIYLLLKNNYYYVKMEQRLAELLTLQTVSDFVNSTLDFEKLLDITLDAIVGLIGLRTCSITVFMDKLFRDIYTRKQKSLVNTVQSSQEVEIDLTKGIYAYLAKKRSLISGISRVDDEIIGLLPSLNLNKGEAVQYVILPITRGDDLFGSINIFDSTLVHLNNFENNFLESFANQFSIALQNANLYRKKEEIAQKDGLTSLYNHAYFQNRLDLLIKEDTMWPLSLIIMDIDDFKKVNDIYGHLTGDKVLKELSSILLKYTRDGDLVARYGGEEFAIVLPSTTHEEAYRLALRLNKVIPTNQILLDNNIPLSITVSIGVAEYKKGWSKEEFVNKVDQLLYQAKNNGKNRVETVI